MDIKRTKRPKSLVSPQAIAADKRLEASQKSKSATRPKTTKPAPKVAPKPKIAVKPAAAAKPKATKPAPKAKQATKTTKSVESKSKEPISRKDIDDALSSIDQETKSLSDPPPPKKRKRDKGDPWSKRRKIITWSIVGVIVTVLVLLGIYAFRVAQNTTNMLEGSMFDLFKSDSLQTDSNGRSNVLIFGTSEDDPDHGGALLADSIMVLSVDPETKESFTVSVPRDMWVKYDTPCSLGREGKINATYVCALSAKNGNKHEASLVFASKVSQVTGLNIQYYAAVNYSVVRNLVDSLGGIEVNIQSEDPRGIYDVATDFKLTNGTHHLDGETALKFSRARNAEGGYGLSQSNFDREKNQQLVLRAIQDRALQTGTLIDPSKVLALTDSLGDNIRTNVRTAELRTAVGVAAGVRSADMASRPLNDPGNMLVTTDRHNDQSIVRPVKGLTDYSDIHEYLKP